MLRELSRGDDGLKTWVKGLPGFVCSTSQEEIHTVIEITQRHPDWVRGTVNEADPWIVAHAWHERRVLVTEENLKGKQTPDRNLKIPNIAQEHDVVTMKFFQFIKEQGWTF